MKTFKQCLDQGPALVVWVRPPLGPDTDEFQKKVSALKDRASAVLISDNPGGEPRMSPLAAAGLAREQGLETIVTLTCRDRNRLALASEVLGLKALGLENLLAVSGDHSSLGPIPEAKPVYDLDSVHLLELIRDLNVGLLPGAVVNPEADPRAPQLAKFKLKAAAGAKFFCTQAVFHPDAFLSLKEEARVLEVKLLAGIRLFHPDEVGPLLAGRRPGVFPNDTLLEQLKNDPEAALEISLAAAREVLAALKGHADGVVVVAPGLLGRMPELLDELGPI